jgi:hypothetical protein
MAKKKVKAEASKHDPTQKHWRIKQLKCIRQVEEMLLSGCPCADVATYIQSDRRESEDVTRRVLAQQLSEYRQTLIGDEVVPWIPEYSTVRKVIKDRLKNVERLEMVYEALMYEFRQAHGLSRRLGRPNPLMVKYAKEIRDTVMRIHDLEVSLGLVAAKEVGTLDVSEEKLEEIRERWGDEAARAYMKPVSRHRVLAAFEHIRRTAAVMDKDGKVIDGEFEVFPNVTDEGAPGKPETRH